jgi:hypothetical protein
VTHQFGHCYFVAEEDTDRVKIGSTWWTWRRLPQLQKHHPRQLILMRVIPGLIDGAKTAEREAHKRFAHLRIVGEWFTYCDEMWDFGKTIDIGPRYTSKYSPHKYGIPQPAQ